jgi:hypothetical protein
MEHSSFEGMDEFGIKDSQNADLAKGMKVCTTCPVRRKCGEDGAVAILLEGEWGVGVIDSHHTVRGGELPIKYSPHHKGRPRKKAKDDERYLRGEFESKACTSGHVGKWIRRADNRTCCYECHRISDQAYKDRIRTNAPKLTRAEYAEKRRADSAKGHFATKGHEGDWYTTGRGRQQCRTCERQRKGAVGPRPSHLERFGHEPECSVTRARKSACLECERQSKAKSREAKRGGPLPSHAEQYGHEPDYRPRPDGRRYCRACKRVASLARAR